MTVMSGQARTSPQGVMPPAAERVVARLRPHARRLVLPSIVLIADCAALGYFAGSFPETWQNIAIVVAGVVVAIVLFVGPLLAWTSRRYVVTTRRIILRHGMLVRVRQELLHSRGYDVTVTKAPLQSVFGSGDVHINSGLEKPVVLRDAPRADALQSALHDLMEHSSNLVATRRQQEQSALPDERTLGDR